MSKLLRLSLGCAVAAWIVAVAGCAEQPTSVEAKIEEQAVLEQSSFYSGETSAAVLAQQQIAQVTSESTGETGVIKAPGSGGGASEGGSISNPGSGGTANPGGGTTNPGAGSGGGIPSSGGDPTAGGGTAAPGAGTNPPSTGGGTTNPATGSGGGTDGGAVVGGGDSTNPNGGTDGGSVTGPGTGGGSQDGGTVVGGGNPAPGNGGGTTGPTNPTNPDNGGGTTGPDTGGPIAGGGGTTTPGGGTDGGTANPGGGTPSPGGGTDSGTVVGGGPTNPGGTDGGTLPGEGNPPGGGTDAGGIACTDPNKCKPLEIKISRICSEMRSRVAYPGFVFFEEAQNPVITLETAANSKDECPAPSSRAYFASIGLGSAPAAHKVETHLVNLLLNRVDMKGVNLAEKKYTTTVQLALEKIQQDFSAAWKSMIVTVRVCDDTDRDGQCSDEVAARGLVMRPATFALTKIPRSVSLEVWSGRNNTVKKNPSVCEVQYSPLLLDLAGDGFRLQGPEEGVKFDLDASGEKVYTGWMNGADDALLVRDLNGNGRIDDGAELFGSATLLSNGRRAANGFEALKDLDSNGDGKISSNDIAWNELYLWLDKNGNGRTDRGELVRPERVRLQSVNLDYVELMEVDPYGNQTRQRSTFRLDVDGKSVARQVIDIWFSTLVIQN